MIVQCSYNIYQASPELLLLKLKGGGPKSHVPNFLNMKQHLNRNCFHYYLIKGACPLLEDALFIVNGIALMFNKK